MKMSPSPLTCSSRLVGFPLRRKAQLLGALAAVIGLAGCAVQTPYAPTPAAWSAGSITPQEQKTAVVEHWWTVLHDPAIDALIGAALADSPTLAQAVARIDEAHAVLGVNSAQQLPNLGASVGVVRAQTQNTSAGTTGLTLRTTTATAGPNLSWEIDFFGRVRHSVEAAQSRLDARTADAAAARLSLAADVATAVLSLRACENTRRVLIDDIASRGKSLALTSQRIAVGFAASIDEARARSGIATGKTSLAAQGEQCDRQANALVALSGRDAATVRRLLEVPLKSTPTPYMPEAPALAPELPAAMLIGHPTVIAADREAAAAWAEIGVARANRLPRLDLAAALTGQWVRAAGSAIHFATWSVGPALTGTLFDGGAGEAKVDASEARYRRMVAALQGTLRSIVQDVENALAAQVSAKARASSASEAVVAAETLLKASEAQWGAGTINLLDLEDSRRQFASAQDAAIAAKRDQAQAWVMLVKAAGGAVTPFPEHTAHE